MMTPTTSRRHVRSGWASLCLVTWLAGGTPLLAGGPDVHFDFARLVEYRAVAPAEPAEPAEAEPRERLIEVQLPISVRFTGLADGEVEHLEIEIDGSGTGLRVERFSPTTVLASEATAVETITKTATTRSIDGTLGGAVPVPVGAVVAHVAPSISAGAAKTNESTEKVRRLPPKRPVVVSGTLAQGQGVFFKFKQSSQTSFEGVHHLAVTFAAPADWDGGSVEVRCTARGHRPVLWIDQPAVFGRVVDVIELSPAGTAAIRHEATAEPASDGETCCWASFVEEARAGIKKTADSIVDVDF